MKAPVSLIVSRSVQRQLGLAEEVKAYVKNGANLNAQDHGLPYSD